METLPSMQYGSKTHALESGRSPDTPQETIDTLLRELKSKQLEWAQKVPISQRIKLLEKTLNNIETYFDEWHKLDVEARHIPKGHWEEGVSYINLGITGHTIRILIENLKSLEKGNLPTHGLKIIQEEDRVTIHTLPLRLKDKLALPGFHAEIHLEKGTTKENLEDYEAKIYRDKNYQGGVIMVLAAGNAAFLAITDTLDKLIIKKNVVLLKIHPVLEYCYELFHKILEPFITAGYLRIVRGGAKVGSYLTHHPSVDAIHITGSDKTFEAIVYGTGEKGQENKSTDSRIINKPVTGELGCVSPVIVVPGDWKEEDFDYQADNILSFLAGLNGYACCAARVLVLPKRWSGSQKLLQKISEKMDQTQSPINYYPGTNETIKEAMTCYANMEKHGPFDDSHQPWMFVQNLDPKNSESAFRREYWSTFMAQTLIDAETAEEFLDKSVEFVNQKLWGTLTATLIIDPKTEKRLTESKFLKKIIDNLHYGVVSVNIFPGFAFSTQIPWGGYPGSTYQNIQSGNCYVQNLYFLSKIEKSVLYAPFQISPRPNWFITGKPKINANKFFAKFYVTNKFSDLFRFLKAFMFGD